MVLCRTIPSATYLFNFLITCTQFEQSVVPTFTVFIISSPYHLCSLVSFWRLIFVCHRSHCLMFSMAEKCNQWIKKLFLPSWTTRENNSFLFLFFCEVLKYLTVLCFHITNAKLNNANNRNHITSALWFLKLTFYQDLN